MESYKSIYGIWYSPVFFKGRNSVSLNTQNVHYTIRPLLNFGLYKSPEIVLSSPSQVEKFSVFEHIKCPLFFTVKAIVDFWIEIQEHWLFSVCIFFG